MNSLGVRVQSTPVSSTIYSCRHYLHQNTFESMPFFLRAPSERINLILKKSLGIYPPLVSNLKSTMDIEEPTVLQNTFIPPILEGRDVLIRDTTGSGKTFGILLALLSKPRRRVGVAPLGESRPGITSVIIVPNQELAFQLEAWTRSLLPTLTDQQFDGLIQTIYTPSMASLDNGRESMLDKYETLYTNKHHQHAHRLPLKQLIAQSSAKSAVHQKKDEQIQRLVRTLPHVLIATPVRLWDLIQQGILDLSMVETLVLDEVDHLIRLPKRFASQKEIFNRDRHPKPAELAVREIMRSAREAGRYDNKSGDSVTDRIQVIAASATMNRPMRHWLETNNWVHDHKWVDTTKSVILPMGIKQHCLVVGPTSVRNIRLASDFSRWKYEKVTHAEEFESVAVKKDDMQEIDWEETDQAWQKAGRESMYGNDRGKDKEKGRDKEKSWEECQLRVHGAAPELEGATAVEKFNDDDDRMLEAVAMACMLDKVDTACVFFCTSFSLNQLAFRLEHDFGINVKQIGSAFDHHQQQKEQKLELGTIVQSGQKLSKGIYIAHESNARGLDLPGVSHVFIVGLPSAPSSYVHMAGRTGRMGKKGQVVTIIRDDGHLEDRARSLFKTLSIDIQPYCHVE
ncbi:hypothetical protein BX616_001308 [Lobosporangium transversale]|nr:hypothetical protein BX616_001308 [Lobosporangium transversale]